MTERSAIWLFDGVCVLCSRGVQYTLKHERSPAIRFVAIQSAEGRRLAAAHGLDPDDPESFLFIEDGVAHSRSEGVLALVRHLKGPVRVVLVGVILPRRFRDFLYDCVARNRYRLFGKKAACMVPDPETMHRFVLPGAG